MTVRSTFRLRILGFLLAPVLVCLAALPHLSGQQANRTLNLITATQAKDSSYEKVLGLLKDAETGQRGFLIARNESFLDPFYSGVAGLPLALDEISALAQTKQEKELVNNIAMLSQEKIAEMGRTIELRRSGRDSEAFNMVAGGRGKRLMDRLRELIGVERKNLAQQRSNLRKELALSLQYNTFAGIGASLISLAIITAGIILAVRGLRQRDEAAKQSQLQSRKNEQIAEEAVLHNEQLSLSAEMLQTVDAVETPDELGKIISVFLKKLFPLSSGAIYLYRNSRDILERSAYWGATYTESDAIRPNECWALRLGRTHQNVHGVDLACEHTGEELASGNAQICVPMLSQGDVNGLMVVTASQAQLEIIKPSFIITVAEQLGLAINNVRLRNSLRHQSTVDPLTGLYNRRYFDDSLKREMVRARRQNSPLSIIMIDLDHFKQINDTYGHDGGDLVLRETGKHIIERIRGSDVACRYGGEEIVLLLSDCTAKDAANCAENIRASLADIRLRNLGQTIAQVSASFGVASWPEHAADEIELIKAADRSLYSAKKTGRNRVCIASEETAI